MPNRTRRGTLLVAAALLGGCSIGKACMSACGVQDLYRRQGVNTVGALSMLKNLFDALDRYAEICGGYPASLAALESPEPRIAPNCERSGAFADAIRKEGTYKEGDKLGMFEYSVSRLSHLRKDGLDHEYRFQYAARDRQDNGTFRTYSLSADPVEREVTGFSSFWMSEHGDIHENRASVATERDPVKRMLVRTRE
jgi:hypothetical protein